MPPPTVGEDTTLLMIDKFPAKLLNVMPPPTIMLPSAVMFNELVSNVIVLLVVKFATDCIVQRSRGLPMA